MSKWKDVDSSELVGFQLAFSLVHKLRSLYSTYNLRVTGNDLPQAVLVAPEATINSLRNGSFLSDLVVPLGKCQVVDMATDKSQGELVSTFLNLYSKFTDHIDPLFSST